MRRRVTSTVCVSMKEQYQVLFKVPWYGQKVGDFIRFLAWVFIF
jgi:hypothetical protein